MLQWEGSKGKKIEVGQKQKQKIKVSIIIAINRHTKTFTEILHPYIGKGYLILLCLFSQKKKHAHRTHSTFIVHIRTLSRHKLPIQTERHNTTYVFYRWMS